MAELVGELKAMAALEAELALLGEDERQRVLQWANARFGGSTKRLNPRTVSVAGAEASGAEEDSGPDLATFYEEKGPSNDGDKALVVAYWLQFFQGHADIEAQRVNTELKHLGHAIGNITRAFENLKSARPALIVQTRKEGSSQQARKKFKVTIEGKKHVERMSNSSGEA